MDASEGSVLHWSFRAALSEKTLSELETYIQYPYLLGMVYITYEAESGIIEFDTDFSVSMGRNFSGSGRF